MKHKKGEQKILRKPTFLYKGVFVFQNSPVIVKDIIQTKNEVYYIVEYIDKEGNKMLIENIKEEELE
ncbi:MAG: hypothetical protein KatS3mg129_1605 [Leptospiraceae bacterium]|nr:MAG: hypothetical protein KatS3mg129_1605 [Leptospiraceae bacterium]